MGVVAPVKVQFKRRRCATMIGHTGKIATAGDVIQLFYPGCFHPGNRVTRQPR